YIADAIELDRSINVLFFHAEDGIRDFHVTGVQTCALPIYLTAWSNTVFAVGFDSYSALSSASSCRDFSRGICRPCTGGGIIFARSEERRVGKERRSARQAEPQTRRRQERRHWQPAGARERR